MIERIWNLIFDVLERTGLWNRFPSFYVVSTIHIFFMGMGFKPILNTYIDLLKIPYYVIVDTVNLLVYGEEYLKELI